MQFRWVAKKSLFSIPVVGWSMSFAGYIAIDRESATRAYRSMLAAAKKIKAGTSVIIFPEGTRNETDRKLLPFKKGSFTLAVKAGVPVVPVGITGTRDIMPRGSLRISPADVTISFAPPIETEGRDEKELMGLTKDAIERIL
jgi:1-acyl-sn-glycerol-3-phosphate acyltransferase